MRTYTCGILIMRVATRECRKNSSYIYMYMLAQETSAYPLATFIPLHPLKSLHTDGDVNLSRPWGQLGKMQDLIRSSMPTTMDGMTKAQKPVLRSSAACGDEVRVEGWPKDQIPLPFSVCSSLAQWACNKKLKFILQILWML